MGKIPHNDLRSDIGLITIQEMAELLDVSESTLQLWRTKGTGPNFVKVGRQIYYLKEDLYAYIRGNRVVDTSERLEAPPVKYKQQAMSYYRFPDPVRDQMFDPPLSEINKNDPNTNRLIGKRDSADESD